MKGTLLFHEIVDMVHKFMDTYKLNVFTQPNANIGTETLNLRYELMKEENEEYLAAAQDGDLIGVADAMGDMLYILCGTILAHGLQDKMEEVFTEIQRSNMSKLGEDGEPIYREDGKVLKGPNYCEPEIGKILEVK